MLVKPIILVSSCKADRLTGKQSAIRQTWAKAPMLPYRFFLGDVAPENEDEVSLDCPDNYFSLPMKTQLSVLWALHHGYTHTFRAFTDTYIDTMRLLQSGFEACEYVGNLCGNGQTGFMHGGCGYWLGPQASQIVALGENLEQVKYEDQWVGSMMQLYGIPFAPDFRYSMGQSYSRREQSPLINNDIISEHLSNSSIYQNKEVYHPSMMIEKHSRRFPALDKPNLV